MNIKHYIHNKKDWRYQRGNQKPKIEEGQTTQWPQENRTKGETRIHNTLHTEN